MNRAAAIVILLISCCAAASLRGQGDSVDTGGVLIAAVQPESAAAAVLQPGDRVMAWAAEPGAPWVSIADPFNFDRIEVTQGTGRPLLLLVRHGSQEVTVQIGVAPWGARAVPELLPDERSIFDDGVAPAASNAAVLRLRELAGRRHERGEARTAVWLRLQSGDARMAAGRFAEAEEDYATSFTWATLAADPLLQSEARLRQARLLAQRNRMPEARAIYEAVLATEQQVSGDGLIAAEIWSRLALLPAPAGDDADRRAAAQALERRRRFAPGSLAEASGWLIAGRVEMRRREMDAARQNLEMAIRIAEQHPESLVLADALDQRGTWYQRRGLLSESDADYTREQRIRERLAPGTVAHANVLNNLGINASIRGDLASADRLWADSTRIYRVQAPDSIDIANVLNNQAINAMLRGRLDDAESLLRESLAIKERLEAPAPEIATAWHNLGIASVERQDLESATTYFRRALDIRRLTSPRSNELASSLNNLAGVARRRRQLDDAEALAREALDLRRQSMPGSLELAFTLTEMGRILETRGDLTASAAAHLEALSIREARAPNSTSVAETLRDLGTLDLAAGRLAQARNRAARALTLWQRLAPGSANEAAAHLLVAHVARAEGRREDVLPSLQAAVEALDLQFSHIGGTQEAQAQFRDAVSVTYGELIEELVSRGDTAAAFQVLERSRARAFLAMLAERELSLSAVPADLARAQRAAAREYETVQDELSSRDAQADDAEITRLRTRLQDVRATQARLQQQVKNAAPRAAALQYPEPLDAPAAARVLEPGTLLMAYAVTPNQTFLFTLTQRGQLRASPIGVRAQDLRDRIARFRRLIDEGRFTTAAPDELLTQANALGTTLLGPATEEIARASRLLIVPDGPLFDLPFAALRPPGVQPAQFLIEYRPLQRAASATTFADLRSLPKPPQDRSRKFIAFGDPQSAAPALPGTRREVQAIATLFTPDAMVATGVEATESLAKEQAAHARVIHFATHGAVNAKRSLDSALVLTKSDKDNGLLQAWEIFEQVRTPADLVVLSACDTGAGGIYAGEGLLGLTRAFQYAGARSVVASLWEVADETAPELMRAFYAALQPGVTKDEALARAQRSVLSRPETRHPFFWAAFVLDGDRH